MRETNLIKRTQTLIETNKLKMEMHTNLKWNTYKLKNKNARKLKIEHTQT